ncbi:MAG: glycosyltransferase [Bacteroidales bacterium]|nr:glycosyltransferase [Bacteroidales bacterium]
MRIAVAVTNDLVTDQRVARSCSALCEAGHSVTLIGRLLPESQSLSRPYRIIRMRLIFRKKMWFYAEYNFRLFFKLLRLNPDMVYANDTDTLLASYCASRVLHCPLFFDAHEMFPEVPELVGRPWVKHFWERIESCLIPRVDAAVTVCQSIADSYRQRMGVNMSVVRNVPPFRPVQDVLPDSPPMLLYQGSVNLGRGIDWMIDAMEFLPDFRLVIAGIGDEFDLMRRYADDKPWSHRIEFLGRLTPEQLRNLTPKATLGLCLLDNLGLNYYYSLPNRIGDFIAAGVPLLATDFPEIRRVIAAYGIGTLVSCQRGPALAQAVRQAVTSWNNLPQSERRERFRLAANDLCWENDKNTLLAAVSKIIDKEKR